MYFFMDLKIKLQDNARKIVEKGQLVYWPEGNSVAISYRPTSISKCNEIILASDCNIWDITDFNLEKLNNLKNHQKIVMIK